MIKLYNNENGDSLNNSFNIILLQFFFVASLTKIVRISSYFLSFIIIVLGAIIKIQSIDIDIDTNFFFLAILSFVAFDQFYRELLNNEFEDVAEIVKNCFLRIILFIVILCWDLSKSEESNSVKDIKTRKKRKFKKVVKHKKI